MGYYGFLLWQQSIHCLKMCTINVRNCNQVNQVISDEQHPKTQETDYVLFLHFNLYILLSMYSFQRVYAHQVRVVRDLMYKSVKTVA